MREGFCGSAYQMIGIPVPSVFAAKGMGSRTLQPVKYLLKRIKICVSVSRWYLLYLHSAKAQRVSDR
ncbi:hypothetical protein SAMN04487894_11258 [Niabella drilacis]|uniref:Uncharacterized protein n=1 Tax=Niabella drilacis (strain DSM 25811 / CCM 8410 / CCUG 62505 / LMG 26954 / E90) TaxID=1285928 RepID=A0A1G6WWW3_NIADE|nr:hypothetical protein SAMN04487894_11258 [Niabella drilacis]